MLEKYRINPAWTLLLAAVAVVGSIVIGYEMLRMQDVLKQSRPG